MMRSTKMKIGLIVAGHVVAGILIAVFCDEIFPNSVTVLFMSFLLGDAGLLGIWLALGQGRLWKRGGITLAATIYVWALGWLASKDVSFVIWFAPPLALVAIGLAVFRRKGLEIALVSPSVVEGLQFSIRHLLGSTTLVAVLLAFIHPASDFFIAWTAMSIMIAVIINGSLLIVRSCGYRLVRSTEGGT